MAAPGFGFSFGDFVQAITILNDVRKALRDTGGAKDEFKNVSIDLQHLDILLEQLHRGSWDHSGDAGHLNAVKGMALTCKVPLQEFLAKLEKHKRLREGDSGSFKAKVGSETRKIRWAVEMKDEVEKFRAVIVAKVVSINLLMQLYTISVISKIETRSRVTRDSIATSQSQGEMLKESIDRATSEVKEANSTQLAVNQSVGRLVQICIGTKVGVEDFRNLVKVQHDDMKQLLKRISCRQDRGVEIMFQTSRQVVLHVSRLESILRQLVRLFGSFSVAALKTLQRILKTNLEIYALLRQLQSSMPRGPMLAIEDSIHFTDALGRGHYLQYQWFKHWNVFESMLKCEFQNLPGEKRVLNGEYQILDARRGISIDRRKWNSQVFPGSDIDMCMIVRGNVFSEGLCPRPGCGRENVPEKTGDFVTCSVCQLQYRSFTYLADSIPVFKHAADVRRNPQTQHLIRRERTSSSEISKEVFPVNEADAIEDLNAFKMIQTVTENHSTQTVLNIEGENLQISRGALSKLLDDLQMSRRALVTMASAWPISRIAGWLSSNAFPVDFIQGFRELNLGGVSFCALSGGTDDLRLRLLQNFEEGKVHGRIRLLTKSGYVQNLDRELERLSHSIKRMIQSKVYELEPYSESPKGEKQKPVKFKDAIGRKFSFPVHLCSTWSGIEDLIRQAFLHVEGIESRVAAGQYDLVGSDGEIIGLEAWESSIRPGCAITMRMRPIDERTERPLSRQHHDIPSPSTHGESRSLRRLKFGVINYTQPQKPELRSTPADRPDATDERGLRLPSSQHTEHA